MSDQEKKAVVADFESHKFVWTVKDVARELQCSVRHVQELIAQDKIPYAKIGRLVRFSPAKVNEWLKKGGTR